MIEQHIDPKSASGYLLIRPNRSMNWADNRRWMAFLSALTLTLAFSFALRGMWPILVASLIQLPWVWLAVYKVALDCQRRECVRFTDAEIVIHRGRYRPVQELRFPRGWTRLVVEPGESLRRPMRLYLRCHGRETELGGYLHEDERRRLADTLRPLLSLPVRHV